MPHSIQHPSKFEFPLLLRLLYPTMHTSQPSPTQAAPRHPFAIAIPPVPGPLRSHLRSLAPVLTPRRLPAPARALCQLRIDLTSLITPR
ncbi:hypothetical protein PYCCODRAFT_1430808 [Trametes coccinea BRFM310]|uniref:Uncharacterized protein n=1 Tax=Trametes coccinea (strain BRFM310) TaxID=1353009 RepID=A0A1Y2J5S7_TRAC3|nr:hypothetical protein PYCCODRAFT_1430808 [Trametes coccinea BRFM310]